MDCRIIMDSVGDRTEEMKAEKTVRMVPLTVIIDGKEYRDDDSLDTMMLLREIKNSKTCPRSACPSPEEFMEAYREAYPHETFVICASSKLTGSYNSAALGCRLFLEEHPDAKISVIDSLTATPGSGLIAQYILSLKDRLSFTELTDWIEKFKPRLQTRFVLEDLSFLEKHGRLSKLAAFLARQLKIVPTLKAIEGEIVLSSQHRGVKRALDRLFKEICDDLRKDPKEFLMISYCNCPDRAADLRDRLLAEFRDMKIHIFPTGGIPTLYAGDHGIVTAY